MTMIARKHLEGLRDNLNDRTSDLSNTHTFANTMTQRSISKKKRKTNRTTDKIMLPYLDLLSEVWKASAPSDISRHAKISISSVSVHAMFRS